jgi:hypothetical protein
MWVQFAFTLLLQQFFAEMVKLVDTLASGASGRKLVEVQVLFSVPNKHTTRCKEAQRITFKLTDEKGLYLLVKPQADGWGKWWRLNRHSAPPPNVKLI